MAPSMPDPQALCCAAPAAGLAAIELDGALCVAVGAALPQELMPLKKPELGLLAWLA